MKQITIKAEHFEGTYYSSNIDCALARQLKEIYPDATIHVLGDFFTLNDVDYNILNWEDIIIIMYEKNIKQSITIKYKEAKP